MATRHYDFPLPVTTQGDDLHSHIESIRQDHAFAPANEVLGEALLGLAAQYELAASLCRQMASVAVETPGVVADACTHHIGIEGPADQLDRLTEGEDALLFAPEWADEN